MIVHGERDEMADQSHRVSRPTSACGLEMTVADGVDRLHPVAGISGVVLEVPITLERNDRLPRRCSSPEHALHAASRDVATNC